MKKLTRRGMLFGLSLPFFSSVTKVAKAEEKEAEWVPIRMFEKRFTHLTKTVWYNEYPCVHRCFSSEDRTLVVENLEGKVFTFPSGDYTSNDHEEDFKRISDILNEQLNSTDDFVFRYDPAYKAICPMRLMKRA